MIEELSDINISDILKFYESIENNISWEHNGKNGSKGKQTSIQYKIGDDCWASSTGRCKGNEQEYNVINPAFKDSPIEEIIKKYSLVRSRLMWVAPMSCYSMHSDSSLRIHIPLITNEDCYFLFKFKPPVHLPSGKVWLVDTRRLHTFINCSDTWRLHIVGATQMKSKTDKNATFPKGS